MSSVGTDGGTGRRIVSVAFLDSATFTTAAASLLTLVGLAAPLSLVGYHRLANGHLALALRFASPGFVVAGVSAWKLAALLAGAR